MKEFQTSLLREKFVIHDPNAKTESQKHLVAVSNRIMLELPGELPRTKETFVVRTQNMHTGIRFAASIYRSYESNGHVVDYFDWDTAWDGILNDYERLYNRSVWAAVYKNGALVFQYGSQRHALLDLIELCESEHDGTYDDSIVHAEQKIKASNKNISIDYDGNVALNIKLQDEQARCGIILRGVDKTTTFSFSISQKDKKTSVSIPRAMNASAAFLEGLQLAFMVGTNNEKIVQGTIKRHGPEHRQTKEAQGRLVQLSNELASIENVFEVNYRPEKPEFNNIIREAEDLAKTVV